MKNICAAVMALAMFVTSCGDASGDASKDDKSKTQVIDATFCDCAELITFGFLEGKHSGLTKDELEKQALDAGCGYLEAWEPEQFEKAIKDCSAEVRQGYFAMDSILQQMFEELGDDLQESFYENARIQDSIRIKDSILNAGRPIESMIAY